MSDQPKRHPLAPGPYNREKVIAALAKIPPYDPTEPLDDGAGTVDAETVDLAPDRTVVLMWPKRQ